MWFGILGPLEVRSADGELVAVGGPRPRSLLAMLLLEAGRVVGTDRLVDGLYGADRPGDAGNALQSQVSRLRGRLGGLIELVPAGYRLAVDPDDVDALRFERLVGAGRRALAAGDHAGAAAVLGDALGLWRGPALADVTGAPFAAAAAARLEELRVTAVEDRAEAGLALGDYPVAELRELVAGYPLRERLRGLLMRALYGTGRQGEALAVFEEGRRQLAEELGADPSPELAEVHLAVLRGSASAGRRLPAALTSFVGRTADLVRVRALLGTARLVTVTGPGGAGKTRLAVEAAGGVPGDVSFVDLSAVTDPAPAVMGALGLREAALLPSPDGAPDIVERLVAALADRPVLLVLDNCEHVIAEAAGLAQRLLTGCPRLRILATSREPLGITGESLHPLPALEIEWAETLFADRAAAVRPGFAGDDAVRRICAALDGLPLAIELAAARLRTLTTAEIEARLDDRFRLLSKGSRVSPPRHQTLRAVVEWSWDLLSSDERMLARRLAVFAGGATAASAAQVCGMPEDRADDLLAGLVDKSLAEVDGGRYRMLDTIREFCAERLADAGERDRIARAHAEYFRDLAATADPHLRRAEQLTWLATLTAEHGNIGAALRWAVRADPGLALELVSAASWYWYLRGVRREIAPLAAELLERADPAGEQFVLCVLWAGGPQASIERAMEIIVTMPGPVRQVYAIVGSALLAGPPGPDAPLTPLNEWFAGTPDRWVQALIRFGMGFAGWYRGGDAGHAERECGAALDLFRGTGDRWGVAQALDALAMFADHAGAVSRALELTDRALDVVGQLGAAEELAEMRCRRADRLLRGGDLAAAAADYEVAAELAGRAGMPAVVALAHCGLGEVARLRGDLPTARRRLERTLADLVTTWANTGARVEILSALGRLAESEGNPAEAGSRYREAVDLATDNRMPAAAAGAAAGLARLGHLP
ncbi:MAG TPA: BTAD domain-containing putative transcriptional regulator [Actinophytocola sp.]|uniref:BTAD domain-containing putative transcriptional regulator n=1 Tax=Actinophytocola sp. TaxID=1872138 RepID=UPI002DBC6478|nr:BTAD domain-containing putative transcriptional regulator [Actinophytocola sp.]HEU5473623.1 BTAD domain-containing putative transcriptional regulator [Actinophytocola sp.]